MFDIVAKMFRYSSCEREDDGSVRLPIAVTDAESGKVVYRGPASDGRLWESLLEDAEALPASMLFPCSCCE
jgi:hypothetical protein